MIVEQTLRYPLPILQPRKRKWTNVAVEEKIPVRILEVSESDAPLVARYYEHRGIGGERMKHDLRWHDGALWRSRITYAYRQPSRQALKADLVEAIAREPVLGFGGAYHDTTLPAYSPEEVPGLGVKQIGPSPRDALIRDIAISMTDLLVIDGVAYDRVSEPVLTTITFGFNQGGSLKLEHFDASIENDANVFRLDNAAKAIEAVNAFGLTNPVEADYGETGLGIEIHRPDLLQFDDRSRRLRILSSKVVRELDKDFLSIATLPALAAFVELRDLTKVTGANPEALIEASRRLLPFLDQGGFHVEQLVEAIDAYERMIAEENSFDVLERTA